MMLNPLPKTSYYCAVAFASLFLAGHLGATPISAGVRQSSSHEVSTARTKELAKPNHSKEVVAKQKAVVKHNVKQKSLRSAAPPRKRAALDRARIEKIRAAFNRGHAEQFTPAQLVGSGVFSYMALKGGTYERNHPVTHIVLHSTETERPADGPRVIRSWNNQGKSHPGAQYVLDRDGVIYQTVDPAQTATMHVNAYKTARYGVSNRNSIGIEIVRAGKQKYTKEQLKSLNKLVLYLQHRFGIDDENIVAHGQIQPSNRTDPVNFNWAKFRQSKKRLHTAAHGGRSNEHLDG